MLKKEEDKTPEPDKKLTTNNQPAPTEGLQTLKMEEEKTTEPHIQQPVFDTIQLVKQVETIELKAKEPTVQAKHRGRPPKNNKPKVEIPVKSAQEIQ